METQRLWLVERSFDDGRILTLTYATEEGDGFVTKQQHLSKERGGVPVSVELSVDEIDQVDDASRQSRYRSEVQRMQERHTPTDRV